jgi:hypothetical protein
MVLDSALAVFRDLDWYRAIILDSDPEGAACRHIRMLASRDTIGF